MHALPSIPCATLTAVGSAVLLAAKKAFHDSEEVVALFRFLQLLCEGHNESQFSRRIAFFKCVSCFLSSSLSFSQFLSSSLCLSFTFSLSLSLCVSLCIFLSVCLVVSISLFLSVCFSVSLVSLSHFLSFFLGSMFKLPCFSLFNS